MGRNRYIVLWWRKVNEVRLSLCVYIQDIYRSRICPNTSQMNWRQGERWLGSWRGLSESKDEHEESQAWGSWKWCTQGEGLNGKYCFASVGTLVSYYSSPNKSDIPWLCLTDNSIIHQNTYLKVETWFWESLLSVLRLANRRRNCWTVTTYPPTAEAERLQSTPPPNYDLSTAGLKEIDWLRLSHPIFEIHASIYALLKAIWSDLISCSHPQSKAFPRCHQYGTFIFLLNSSIKTITRPVRTMAPARVLARRSLCQMCMHPIPPSPLAPSVIPPTNMVLTIFSFSLF